MAKQDVRTFHIRKGAKFGPVVFSIAPLVSGGTVDLSGGAYVRLRVGDVSRDSTVAGEEITVDDTAKTVTWTMLEDDTSALSAGRGTGALVCIDGAAEDHQPLDMVVIVTDSIGAPS